MLLLGIETSCDETAVAIVRDGWEVLANVIFSQAHLHEKTGGVVPEVAAREQVEQIVPCLREALSESGCSWDDIDGIAVTRGPGLIGSLLTGVNAARTLSWLRRKPLVGINHIEGHVYANWLGVPRREIEFPVVILTASGGHNELLLMRGHGDFELLGETLDDAAGEAFDKVSRVLGLGYPGGPAIARAAEQGNPDAIRFPRAWLQEVSAQLDRPKEIKNFNFSFSGLKTAVLRELEKYQPTGWSAGQPANPAAHCAEKLAADIAASFQKAVVDVLASKAVAAAKKFKARELHLAGGVSANTELRRNVTERAKPLTVRFPEQLSYCTDNAAMVAAAGHYRLLREGARPWQILEATPAIPKL